MKKLFFIVCMFLLTIPVVYAEEEECGLLNLATCIPEKMYDFFLNIINAPIQPLIDFIKILLTEPVILSLFTSLWAIMVYVLSLFYGLLMMYAGLNFIISGYDPVKRMKAKEWFKNILIMIILIEASYFVYAIFVDMSALLTAGVINLIDENFFRLTADNVINIGFQFFFSFIYSFTLISTALILLMRYVIVIIGVVFAPIAIFLYFTPPLKKYGKLIMNFLGVCIFITFFDAVILLCSSMLIQLPFLENFKILLMITAFGICNLMMAYLMFFAAIKSGMKAGATIVAIKSGVGAAVLAGSAMLSQKKDPQRSLKEFT